MNPQAAGGGTLPSELNNSGEGGGWAYLKALQAWGAATVHGGTGISAPSSTAHVVTQRGPTNEAAYDDRTRDVFVHNSLRSSICGSGSSTTNKRPIEVLQQQEEAVLGKKVARPKGRLGAGGRGSTTRWETHNKRTCKCAVCMQCRGELKGTWYKHDQLTCACAVCRQSRGDSRPKEAHRVAALTGGVGLLCTKHSLRTIPGKRASWLSTHEQQPSTECWACSREVPCYGGGGQQQIPSRFASQQQSTYPPCGGVLNSSVASSPLVAILGSCNTTTGIPMPWQQKLTNLAGHTADCSSSLLGVPSVSSPLLAPTTKCAFDAHHEQRFAFSFRAENSISQQQAFQTTLFSNPRCSSGWPNSERSTCPKKLIGNDSDVVQQCTSDCVSTRRSCENRSAISYNCGSGLSCQNVDRLQDVAGPSTRLHNADTLQFVETRKVNLPWAQNPWEPVPKTSSPAPVTERNCQWSSSSNARNIVKSEVNPADPLSDPFYSLGQTSSFFGGHPPSMTHAQPPCTASHPAIFQHMKNKPVYVPLQISNSLPDALSSRSSSVAQFPFGLEVQAQAEYDVHHPVSDLEAPMHAQTISFNCDEDTTESNSHRCQTTSPTNMWNERDKSSPLIDVDAGDTRRSSRAVLKGSLEKLILLTEVDTGDPVRHGQLQSGLDKEVSPTKPTRQKFTKRLANSAGYCSVVRQKRTKRDGVLNPVPKWCQLIHAKYNIPTIVRKIFIRARVPRKCLSDSSNALERSLEREENSVARSPNLSARENNLEGRSRHEESTGSSGLQSTDSTGVRECTTLNTAQRDMFVMPEENIPELRENAQESPSYKNCLISSGAEVLNNPQGKITRELKGYRIIPERLGLDDVAPATSLDVMSATELQWDGHSFNESEARERIPFSSLSYSVSPACRQEEDTSVLDISSIAANARRPSISAIDDHLGKTLQLTVYRSLVAKVCQGCQGRKRSRTDFEICDEGGESGMDPPKYLIPEFEGARLIKPRKKPFTGRSHRGASACASLLCTNTDHLFRGDLVRIFKSSGGIDKLVVEVILLESMKVYYFTRILKARTPEVTAWATGLVRDMAHQRPSILVVQSHPSLPKGYAASLWSTVEVCPAPLRVLLTALKFLLRQKSTGFLMWSETISGMSIHSPSNIGKGTEFSSEDSILGTRSRLDEQILSRFWHEHCTHNCFLSLPRGWLTVYMDDVISYNPVDSMVKEASSSSSAMRKHGLLSFVYERNLVFSQQESMNAIHQHWQSLTHEVGLTPLRNIVFPYWIDKPLEARRHLTFLGILLRGGPPRLRLCSDAADQYVTSGEQDRTAECLCERVLIQCSAGENLEGNFSGELQRIGKISSDGVLSEQQDLIPVNALQPTEHEPTPGSSVFHGDCTKTIETRSLQTPSASSFQDLLKSVLQVDNTSSPLSNDSECRPDLREELHQISSNDCSRSIPGLDVWERHADQRNNCPTSAALTCSSDSVSKPARRRGCPKGGWPKKTKAKKNTCFPADEKDGVDVGCAASQHVADVEADIEVFQPKKFRISSRQVGEFKKKLEAFLDRPFQVEELNDLEEHACLRKPLLRLRETRQRVLHVATNKEGLSYLDYHPDLARKVAEAVSPEERLQLFRGFFFWLQHSCTSGSFRPWAPNVGETKESDDDCVEIFPKEEVVRHVYKMATAAKATVESHACQCKQSSARETNQTGMTLRTRGRNRKSASQPNKSTHLSEQLKPSLEATVKREREEMRRNKI